jgi:glycosyltransferase involved in cell wall biosynthesis
MDLASRLQLDVLNIQYQAAAYGLHPAINFLPWRVGFPRILGKRREVGQQHTPIAVTFHDLMVPYLFPKAGPLRQRVVMLLARQADAAIVTNRADELALTAQGVGRVERIPIGSNITPTLPDDYDRDVWRTQIGVTPTDFLLGFFGFFNARKGVETLIRALAALDPRYHLLFIGGTVGSSDPTNRAYADRMADLVTDLGLSGRVHYTGYVSAAEVSATFAAVDLCVLPYADGVSFHHGTLMAALAHSQAIISTQPAIELPELVHEKNAWLIPANDPDDLVSAISFLAASPKCRQRLSHGASELSAQFSWERIAARTAQLFDALIRRD